MADETDEDRVPDPEELESLLADVKDSRGVDLTGYKRTTLSRRVLRRMHAVGVDSDFGRYRVYLRSQPQELNALFDSLFINVTSFFRDREAWEYLDDAVLPRILAQRPGGSPIRVWSAGCATGEEPFSIAMLLAERLGLEDYVRRVKIFATDWDELALQQARHARYAGDLETVPAALRQKYFQPENGDAVLHHALRRSVIFGQHDLANDAPISRVDLLLCRNTLMYFNVAAQRRILTRLHFALAGDGYLFLGRAEMLLGHGDAFTPVELRHRIFRKQARNGQRDVRPLPPPPRDEDLARAARLREAALEASPVAQIVLDPQRRIAVVNHLATLMFPIGAADVGRQLQDLELSYRPIDLRSLVDECLENRRSIERKGVEYRPPGRDVQYLDISATPAFQDSNLVAVTFTFADVTEHKKLEENLQRFSENLETAYEELQSANEELETTNEELQSSNEELETTNEELQAANEEMETVNEELRSTNEEFQSTNDALRLREIQLGQSNAFVNAILGTLRIGIAVVGEDLKVRVWNDLAAELWGLRSEEVIGKGFAELDIGLPVQALVEHIERCLAKSGPGESREILVDAINRRGRKLVCRVLLTPLTADAGIGPGVCILMEDSAARGGSEGT
jgi:two-component system, chemotaxis family, CheB/CheR fusion protein